MTARVQVQLIISPNSDGVTHHISSLTTTARSEAKIPAPCLGCSYSVSAKGTSTTEITNATTEADKSVNFTLSVTGTNGFSGLPGAPAGDIALDINFTKTPDGRVGINEGSQARTYPSIAIYRYQYNDQGTITTVPLIGQTEQNIDDLTKPKQPLPTVKPR